MSEESILARLTAVATNGTISPEDEECVRRAIKDLIHEGWTNNEIALYLRWCEHVDTEVEEDVALRNMKRIREQVTARMAA